MIKKQKSIVQPKKEMTAEENMRMYFESTFQFTPFGKSPSR